jgi:hypothetical protein
MLTAYIARQITKENIEKNIAHKSESYLEAILFKIEKTAEAGKSELNDKVPYDKIEGSIQITKDLQDLGFTVNRYGQYVKDFRHNGTEWYLQINW